MAEWDEITQIGAKRDADRILLVDANPASRQWFREVIAGQFALDEVDAGTVALEMIAAGLPRLVVVGPVLADMAGNELLDRASQWLGERGAPITTLLVADASGAVADVDESRIKVFYRLVPTMPAGRVIELLSQAVAKLPPKPPVEREVPAPIADAVKAIGDATEPADVAKAAIAAVQALAGADRVRCLFCDEDSGSLWAEGEEAEAQASAGLAGFAVRTNASIAVPHAADDALYDHDIDDPAGTGRERLLVQPIAGLDGHVHAVLVAVRGDRRPPFGNTELATLEMLASAWAPYLQQLAMRVEADNILGDRLERGPSDMFRQEAIMSLVRRGASGDVVRVHPGWVRAAYWLVLASLAGAIAFAAIAHVHQYAEGPAIVKFTGRQDVNAPADGTISSIDVQVGQAVKAGDRLVQLSNADEATQVQQLQTDFEDRLVAYLQNQADRSIQQALGAARNARDTALEKLKLRLVRAPISGVVKEVLVRSGQRVEASKVLMTIAETGAVEGLSLVAFLPGGDRPRLHTRQPLSLTLPGFRGARFSTDVRTISPEVMDAKEAIRKYIGDRAVDSVPIAGTVVVVEAKLASGAFEADGQAYELHDGMLGVAEIQLASHSVLETVIPGLRR
jgi:multidrug efflux pump subunit AcrA (membrane-fusion protein)/CheY-like chemotaxis protein